MLRAEASPVPSTATPPSRFTVVDAGGHFDYDRWMRALVARPMRKSTAQRYVARLKYARTHGFDLDRIVYSGESLRHFTAVEVVREYLYALDERHLKDSTYNSELEWIHALLEYLGVPVRFRGRRRPEADPSPLGVDELVRVRRWKSSRTSHGRLGRALVHLNAVAGLDVGELSALDRDDVLPAREGSRWARLHVRHPTKGHRARTIPIPRGLLTRTHPFGAYLRRWQPLPDASRPLFVTSMPGRRGHGRRPRRVTTDYVRKLLWVIGRDVHVRLSARRLRSSVGTRLHDEGASLLFIMRYLGLSNLESALHYVRLRDEDLEQFMDRLSTKKRRPWS